MAGMGIFSIPGAIGKNGVDGAVYGLIIAMVVATVLGFALQMIFGRKSVDETLDEQVALANANAAEGADSADATAETATTAKPAEATYNEPEKLVAPLNGTIVALKDVKDEVFSSGSMGQGVAIEPKEGKVCAPFDCEVAMTFPTGHAIGLRSAKGAEVMIHIGMDTVELDGEGFKILVEKDQSVKAGDPLIEFDLAAIKKAGYEVTTPVIVTNTNNYHEVNVVASGEVSIGDQLLDLE